MFEVFTEAARQAILFARDEALQSGSKTIETRHLLLGVMRSDHSLCGRVLGEIGLECVRERLSEFTPERSTARDEMPFSDQCKRALSATKEAANTLHSKEITPEHLLMGLTQASPAVRQILASLKT